MKENSHTLTDDAHNATQLNSGSDLQIRPDKKVSITVAKQFVRNKGKKAPQREEVSERLSIRAL